jgi:Restriction Enzyme Adenine Methylase Associated
MPTIEVDFDVFKALTARRPAEDVTENDVLRQLLRLPPRTSPPEQSDSPGPEDWVTKGVRLPSGTELRATYKGQTYLARVASGALVLDGKRFNSPSAAAMAITRNPVNGWTFWECRLPGQGRWRSLKELRRSK